MNHVNHPPLRRRGFKAMPTTKVKPALYAILSKAVATRKRTRSGEDRDVVMLLKGVEKAVEAIEGWR